MPRPELLAVLTALLLFGVTGGAHAEYKLDQLEKIDSLVSSKDVAGLRSYLAANPGLMRGNDELARELGRFFGCAQDGGVRCFSSRISTKKTRDGLARASTTQRQPTQIY